MNGYVERGLRNQTLATVLRMAAAMNVDFEEILRQARKELANSTK